MKITKCGDLTKKPNADGNECVAACTGNGAATNWNGTHCVCPDATKVTNLGNTGVNNGDATCTAMNPTTNVKRSDNGKVGECKTGWGPSFV